MRGSKRNSAGLLLLMLAIGSLSIFLITKLFILRFNRGDIYPPYSSLRTDPRGTKILYESLSNYGNVSRNFKEIETLQTPSSCNLFVLGFPSSYLDIMFSQSELIDMEGMLNSGCRLVMTLAPEAKKLEKEKDEEEEDSSSEKKKKKDEKKTEAKKEVEKKKNKEHKVPQLISQKWNFSWDFKDLPKDADDKTTPVKVTRTADDTHLPDSISWYSGTYFKDLGPEWKVLYSRDSYPVLIERSRGKGSIIIASDTYFLSNEAMFLERHPELLSYLVGEKSNIIFDEMHFGMSENPGVASLLRRYGLETLVFGMILLMALFVWKNSSSLIPRHPYEEKSERIYTNADHESGFINLLKQNIPPAELLDLCANEWNKTASRKGAHIASEMAQIQNILNEEKLKSKNQINLIHTYNRINNIFKERKYYGKRPR
jgi:hypothetical protein